MTFREQLASICQHLGKLHHRQEFQGCAGAMVHWAVDQLTANPPMKTANPVAGSHFSGTVQGEMLGLGPQ